jgi:hypothetical protein
MSGIGDHGEFGLTVKSNADIDREQEREQIDLQKQENPKNGLASYVRTCWDSARNAKSEIQTRIEKSHRQRKGTYEPDKLAQIKQHGGSEIFMKLTEEKCVAAEAWFTDILIGQQDKPWGIKPTPVPELPRDVKHMLRGELAMKLREDISLGLVSMEDFQEAAENVENDLHTHLVSKAKKEAAELEVEMNDILEEGGYYSALEDVITDLTTYPCAFIKAPVVRFKPKLGWDDYSGEIKVKESLSLEFERVSASMIYPSPSSTDIGDSYLFEHHRLLKGDLYDLIGVGGFDEVAIRSVLDDSALMSAHTWLDTETQRNPENGEMKDYESSDPDAKIDALQFWGSISGKLLIEYGMSKDDIPDPEAQYDVEVWLIGSEVIKAQVNPDKLGRPPYYKASFRNVPGSFWGESLCDVIRDIQDVCNATARALVNNMAISSGPQVAVNSKELAAGEDIKSMYPWKIWQFENPQKTPIWFFQPNSMTNELMKVYEFFSNEADNKTGLPKYAYGQGNQGGALSTATGFSMMINNATKLIRATVRNIDRGLIVGPLKGLYYWKQIYMPFENYTGDANIVAKGSSALAAKEQQQMRRQELLSIMLHPNVMQITGKDGLASLLRGVVKGADLDVDDIIPSKTEMTANEQIIQMQQYIAQLEASTGVNPAGQVMSGKEYQTV